MKMQKTCCSIVSSHTCVDQMSVRKMFLTKKDHLASRHLANMLFKRRVVDHLCWVILVLTKCLSRKMFFWPKRPLGLQTFGQHALQKESCWPIMLSHTYVDRMSVRKMFFDQMTKRHLANTLNKRDLLTWSHACVDKMSFGKMTFDWKDHLACRQLANTLYKRWVVDQLCLVMPVLTKCLSGKCFWPNDHLAKRHLANTLYKWDLLTWSHGCVYQMSVGEMIFD